MNPELVLGIIQTVFSILAVAIAAAQLLQQWPRSRVEVRLDQFPSLAQASIDTCRS
jgi:hypothetical protein